MDKRQEIVHLLRAFSTWKIGKEYCNECAETLRYIEKIFASHERLLRIIRNNTICGNGDAWMEIKNAVEEAEELIRN